MSTVPAIAPPMETVEQRFCRLAETLEAAVRFQSSPMVRINHPAHREIVAMGPVVIPFMLREVEARHAHWYDALQEITGADPIPEVDAGIIARMAQAWLNWAREHG